MTFEKLLDLIVKRIDLLMDDIEKDSDLSYLTDDEDLLKTFKFYVELYNALYFYKEH